MIKRLLLTGVLGVFSSALFAQGLSEEYDLYMYSGRFSNPALSGVKEFGTSLTYMGDLTKPSRGYYSDLTIWSHGVEIGQSLFSGKGGLEMRWNHSDYFHGVQHNSGTLGYSQGFRLGTKWILRTGLSARLFSFIFSDLSSWGAFINPNTLPGNDLRFVWNAGVSIHQKQFYAALGTFLLTPIKLKEVPGLEYAVRLPVFTAEFGAIFDLYPKSEKLWKRSLQPFLKGYMLNGVRFFSFGTFVNYGPLQFGTMVTSGSSARVSVGLNNKHFRFTYSYAGPNMTLSGINAYSGTPNHELGLRFILPGKDKEADFMKNVYRGF